VAGYETMFAHNIFPPPTSRRENRVRTFLHAGRVMGAAPNCLVIEDSVAGVAAARAARMTVFGLSA
jgi:HAD superfamily hydrolase (TIGR01509 family)